MNYGNGDLDAVVVGAGFSGLYQLYCLREKLKLRVKVLEAGGGCRRYMVLEPLSWGTL
jgi:cation diffusion facilitator CzcD-associated flavoprotein CzcO